MDTTHKPHVGESVRIGPYVIFAGSQPDIASPILEQVDVIVALTPSLPALHFSHEYRLLAAFLEDFGGVPTNWKDFLQTTVIPLLAQQKKLLVYCGASHGRTGTFLASLVALLESKEETPDPIAAVRERYCQHAVETQKQAVAVFALRGETTPNRYISELLA